MKRSMGVYRTLFTAFLFGCPTIALGVESENSGLDTEIVTVSDSQISQSQFCPDEPVVIYARMTNMMPTDLELRLVPGDSNRALIQIRDSSGAVVWDTEELDRIEEARHMAQHGIGRIFAEPVIYHKVLKSKAMVFWISHWEQLDMKGELVEHGEYLIDVSPRWRLADDGEALRPIRFQSAKIVISSEGCE